MKQVSLHILDLEHELKEEFFGNFRLPREVTVKSYKTLSRFIKSLETKVESPPNLLLFIPASNFSPESARRIRLTHIESPMYIVTRECPEHDYLSFISMGINGILLPPFSKGDVQRVLNGRCFDEVPFPRSNDVIREGQVRLDFLLPSKLSRILGVNRLVSFLAAEFGFPAEECKVNLPMVMDEALSNAILHGNKGNEKLKVHVRIYISSHRIVIQVEDQGDGFIPEGVEDPRERENIYKKSGRGIYLIKELMDKVTFKKNGSIIEVEKNNPFSGKQ